MAQDGKQTGSTLLLEECFDAEDPRFVEQLRAVRNSAALAVFVERLKRDPRPWAREQIFAYLEAPLDVPGHQVVVKRLFKHAQAEGDHELVGAFLVAFDRLVRRELAGYARYGDGEVRFGQRLRPSGKAIPLALNTPPNSKLMRRYHQYLANAIRPEDRLFSLPTRHYLRRRAWRYFRWLGYGRPAEYLPAAAGALARYAEEDFAGEAGILDHFGLMQICFHGSEALTFGPRSVDLRPGRALREVRPAPRFPELWETAQGFDALLGLVAGADSRPVRTFAMKLLAAKHADRLADLEPDRLGPLLAHPDPTVNEFAASLFARLTTLDRLPVADWLALLAGDQPNVLALIAEAMKRHVRPDRVSLADAARLALAESAPVAGLGLFFLGDRQPRDDEERLIVSCLYGARSATAGREIARFALSRLSSPEHYRTDDVIEFFDAPVREVRDGAWDWLTGSGATGPSRGAGDALLFARLTETPYDDVRLKLIGWLSRRAARPGTPARDLGAVWATVLLGVHRGGRHKQAALRQLTEAVIREPELAGEFVPVIAVAVRSVRRPEQAAGLAALARIVTARPELEPLVTAALPEVSFAGEEAGS